MKGWCLEKLKFEFSVSWNVCLRRHFHLICVSNNQPLAKSFKSIFFYWKMIMFEIIQFFLKVTSTLSVCEGTFSRVKISTIYNKVSSDNLYSKQGLTSNLTSILAQFEDRISSCLPSFLIFWVFFLDILTFNLMT